jgi:hypothetical protein
MLVAALGIFHANVRRAAQAVVILTKGKMNTDSNDLQVTVNLSGPAQPEFSHT